MPVINNETIKSYDQERNSRSVKIRNNTEYVKGRNPATLNAEAQKKPDNRITIPLAKITVDIVHGYAGRAGDMQLFYENIKTKINESEVITEDAYISIMQQISEHNEEPVETSELYHNGLTQGYSYELLWVSDTLALQGVMTPEFKKIPVNQVVILWSRDLKPIKEAVLRFQDFGNDRTLDVYYPLYSERWERLPDKDAWVRNKDGDTVYPYTSPPLVIYGINEDQESLFEAEKGLIDSNDKILNKTVNEIDRFNALIALMPGEITKETREKLIQAGVIDKLQQFDHWPEYMQKDLSGINELYTGAAKWIKDLFFQSVSVPDFSDKEFLNAASGIAMAYKLLGLEFLASKIDTYFSRGLQERFNLINDVIGESPKYNIDDYKLVIKQNRNLPIDRLSAAEVALKLLGIVSKKTLLRMLPIDIVDDADKELERLKLENENSVNLDAIPPLTIEG
ncbi:MAG: phage portal protein [Spirochaetia bacterium]|jgi:SPP1 family phage portal protein|nr:phage portal protein [Spirochaetia bacterium]